jgi:CubicO group peptidase (beta-lactamase class C family)
VTYSLADPAQLAIGVANVTDQAIRLHRPPGAQVAVFDANGEILASHTSGWADLDARVPLDDGAIYRIGSMTKPVLAAATMILVERGEFVLSEPIAEWVPELGKVPVLKDPDGPINDTVAVERPITILDLLTHRSGLAYPFTIEGSLSAALAPVDIVTDDVADPDDWLAHLGRIPLAAQPGERFIYGLSYDVLGCLISRVRGQSLENVLRELIFEPLGMVDSGFWVPEDKINRLPTAYCEDPDGNLQILDDRCESKWTNAKRFQSGGGGLVSTVADYARFAHGMMYSEQSNSQSLLSADSIAQITTHRLSQAQRCRPVFGRQFFAGQGYGLGVSIVDDPAIQREISGPCNVGTFGWSGIFGTHWRADPVAGFSLVYMSQLQSTNLTIERPAQLAEICLSPTGTSDRVRSSAAPQIHGEKP